MTHKQKQWHLAIAPASVHVADGYSDATAANSCAASAWLPAAQRSPSALSCGPVQAAQDQGHVVQHPINECLA